MSQVVILNDAEQALEYHFELTRHGGKSSSLRKGNQVLNANDRLYFAVKNEINAYLRELAKRVVLATHPAFSLARPRYSVTKPCSVLITIDTPTRRRFDPPNLYPTIKPLIDGMTQAGVWEDDNSQIIRLMGFRLGVVTANKKYCVHISITRFRKQAV